MGLLAFVAGIFVAVACILLGAWLTVHVGGHFIDNYVKKWTPEEAQKLQSLRQPTDHVSEETMWASGMTEDEFKQSMGWLDKDRDEKEY